MHSCSASSGKPDSNSLDCIVFFLLCDVSTRLGYLPLQMSLWQPLYPHCLDIRYCRCSFSVHYNLQLAFLWTCRCFSAHLSCINCIYILPFLVLEDTSFTNFASTSHIFYDLRILLIEIMHLQFPKIHYRRYRRSISFKFYLVHDDLQARKDYALLRELRRASPTPIRRSA